VARLGSDPAIARLLLLLGRAIPTCYDRPILLNWWAASLYVATRRRAVITAAIVVNLAVLGIFKYTDFFADTFASVF
jgi:hypothetical protein